MELSVVTTLYKSQAYVHEFYERVIVQLKKITSDYEIIFVNDGSPDDSLEKAIEVYKPDVHVKIIDLSRNFGHHKAMMTGLSHASGDYVFLIDSDLEEVPELLGVFWDEMQSKEDVDVVYGVQKCRKGGWFERWSGLLFYKLFNKLSSVTIPKNVLTARLMTKRYTAALVEHQEREVVIAGLWVITGFTQVPISVNKMSHSETSYSLVQRFALLSGFITSFSNTPLKFILYLGCTISLFSMFFVMYIILNKLLFGMALEGWSSLIASVWFLGGLILFSIGIVGIYVSKVFSETKARPYTIIKRIYER